jgi:uncharacterized damage-inducible protein DinB
MNTTEQLQKEFDHEFETTKKFISAFPEGKNEYTPHEKSMKMMQLATHIVEIFAWPKLILSTEVLDFAKGDYQPTHLSTKAELIEKLSQDFETGKQALAHIDDGALQGRWAMKMGEQVLQDWSKYEALRHSLNQITHHRAQLGVYYRLNNIPLPGAYGPSADEANF